MVNKITQALERLFQQHRIVFWYDAKKELRHEYETLSLPGVRKIELDENELGVKHQILKEEPDQKFLLYNEGPQPEDLDNWLLDVLLAHGQFNADQVSLWMAELGLGPGFWDLVQEHADFFRAKSRMQGLKTRLGPEDGLKTVRTKMLAVCVNKNTEARLESLLEALLAELAEARDEKIYLIQRCGLDQFLWNQLDIHFGYSSETPGIRDFAIELFKSCYALSLDEEGELSQDALVFLKRWKDNVRHQQAFEILSDDCADILDIEKDLQSRDINSLIEIDFFKLVDQKILTDIIQQVAGRTISAGDCSNLIWRRRGTHWYAEFSDIYEAVDVTAQFMASLEKTDLSMGSMADGIRKYVKTWYHIDQLYRKFIYHLRVSKQTTLLNPLHALVENLYTNNFLLKVNDNWQQHIDSTQGWDTAPTLRQDQFFEHWVGEFRQDQVKVAVVISDALRYEIGQEIVREIEEEDRFTADIEPMLSMLPSYTQLGMAALLPQEGISIDEKGVALIEGQSSAGTRNRNKILQGSTSENGIALRSADLLAMSRKESRNLVKNHQIIYVYHNQIDATGDDRKTEGRVFEAVEGCIVELIDIFKKLTNANLSNMILTADHGFIYQDQDLDESEFTKSDVEGREIYKRDRRFVIGKGLIPNPSVKIYQAADLGLSGDFEVAIPKSINRLRLKGAGSRFVHGGASLQEVVLPVIKINKTRTSDVSLVEVDIISSSSSIITTGQLSVALYQEEPVTAKRQPRNLRAGIYTQEDELISDRHDLTFDLASDNPREREVRVRFVLSSKADEINNQDVYLKLEERVPGTSHYKVYKTRSYLLRRSFTSDFDF